MQPIHEHRVSPEQEVFPRMSGGVLSSRLCVGKASLVLCLQPFPLWVINVCGSQCGLG